MAELHIVREHRLGLPAARKIAFAWAEQVEAEFGMACTYAQGKTADEVGFSRAGVEGRLRVSKTCFELNAQLGFLLGAFKARIEGEIVRQLDQLLSSEAPAQAPSRQKK